MAFFLFDWVVLTSPWRWLAYVSLFFCGLQLAWAGWRAFSPKGRRLRDFAKDDLER